MRISNDSPHKPADSSAVLQKLWNYGGRPVAAGAVGGATVAGLCTPWDRMINVASDRGIPFRDAFKAVLRSGPYRGFVQTVGQRTIQGVTGMPLYDMGKWGLDKLTGNLGGESNAFLSGVLIGGVTGAGYGIIATPKYQTWRTHEPFLPTVKRMAREGGVGAFTKGIYATASRDMVFGGVFYPIKRYGMAWAARADEDGTPRSKRERHLRETAVAAVAVTAGVMASSPLNYTRTRAFNTPPAEADLGVVRRLGELVKEASASKQAGQVIRQRLVFGAGAGRAVIGMFLQSRIYDLLMQWGQPAGHETK